MYSFESRTRRKLLPGNLLTGALYHLHDVLHRLAAKLGNRPFLRNPGKNLPGPPHPLLSRELSQVSSEFGARFIHV